MAGSGARMVSGQLLATLFAGVGLVLLILAMLTYRQVTHHLAPPVHPPSPAATTQPGRPSPTPTH